MSDSTEARKWKPIPIRAAKLIAEEFDYDQVIIFARKVGPDGGEHCTTYGVDHKNCIVAARIGDFFKYELAKWPRRLEEQKGKSP